MAVIQGLSRYAFVQNANTSVDPPQWSIDLEITEEQAKQCEKDGLTCVTQDDDGTYLFKSYRTVYRKKGGGANKPPVVRDAGNNDTLEIPGDGSLCKVQYRPWSWKWKKQTGISADLAAVQILKLVPYGMVGGAEFEAEDGWEDEADVTHDSDDGVTNPDDPPY